MESQKAEEITSAVCVKLLPDVRGNYSAPVMSVPALRQPRHLRSAAITRERARRIDRFHRGVSGRNDLPHVNPPSDASRLIR